MRITLIVLFLSSIAPVAFAATLVVHPDGSGDYATIQAAINAASAGDIVELTDGTYLGDGNRDLDCLGKAITVRSASGDAGSCIIDCGGWELAPHRGFYFHTGEGADTRVEGIRITGGWQADTGGGIRIYVAGPTIYACSVTNNSVISPTEERGGGGVHIRGSGSPVFIDCTFSGNSVEGVQCRGGGVYCESMASFTGCTFSGNSAVGFGALGGGAQCLNSAATFDNCTFTDNQVIDGAHFAAGGGLHSWHGSLSLTGCFFSGNEGSGSGGGACFIDDSAVLDHCTFALNTAVDGAGLATCIAAGVQILNCTFCENTAQRYGGAITTGCSSHLILESTLLAFNTAGAAELFGGGLACLESGSSAALSCCNIYGNVGGDWVECLADQLGQAGNLTGNPCFCADSYLIARVSPCYPDSNECGVYIGAWGDACSECGEPAPTWRTSWGRIKSLFLNEG